MEIKFVILKDTREQPEEFLHGMSADVIEWTDNRFKAAHMNYIAAAKRIRELRRMYPKSQLIHVQGP